MKSKLDESSEDVIRVRAFLLWEADGRQDGRDEYYWHQALVDLKNEQIASASSLGVEPVRANSTSAGNTVNVNARTKSNPSATKKASAAQLDTVKVSEDTSDARDRSHSSNAEGVKAQPGSKKSRVDSQTKSGSKTKKAEVSDTPTGSKKKSPKSSSHQI